MAMMMPDLRHLATSHPPAVGGRRHCRDDDRSCGLRLAQVPSRVGRRSKKLIRVTGPNEERRCITVQRPVSTSKKDAHEAGVVMKPSASLSGGSGHRAWVCPHEGSICHSSGSLLLLTGIAMQGFGVSRCRNGPAGRHLAASQLPRWAHSGDNKIINVDRLYEALPSQGTTKTNINLLHPCRANIMMRSKERAGLRNISLSPASGGSGRGQVDPVPPSPGASGPTSRGLV